MGPFVLERDGEVLLLMVDSGGLYRACVKGGLALIALSK